MFVVGTFVVLALVDAGPTAAHAASGSGRLSGARSRDGVSGAKCDKICTVAQGMAGKACLGRVLACDVRKGPREDGT